DAVSSYLLKVTKLSRRRLTGIFERNLGVPSMKRFVSTYEKITSESEARGRRRGKAEGKAEGKTQGKAEGRAEILLLQLSKRFGAVPLGLRTRVAAATSRQLDRWAERLLDAESLDDVFATATR
ncbi:MAG: DUF4351 domain-containing protein, partial [Planctomycetota bacterium]